MSDTCQLVIDVGIEQESNPSRNAELTHLLTEWARSVAPGLAVVTREMGWDATIHVQAGDFGR